MYFLTVKHCYLTSQLTENDNNLKNKVLNIL